MNIKKLSVLSSLILATAGVQAEQFFTDTSISALYGTSFEAYDFGNSQNVQYDTAVLTIENVSAHNWGDTFLFIDITNNQSPSTDGVDDVYGELSGRLSLSYLTNSDLSFGPIKDVLLAGAYEYGGGVSANNKLYGVGLALAVPAFQYVNVNTYYVDNQTLYSDVADLQLTVTWGLPFTIASTSWVFDGFIDWSTAESDHNADFHFNPQLKIDLGELIGAGKGNIEMGVEYSYWINKYGIAEMDDENAFSLLAKFHF
ncbi:MAG: DUF5020 family protein [Moritella sp.]|uniref:DUF5020 family protein n=1 Tax=unclassified Moritella TaxID=2637987 RepID=UPI0001569037|nr:MULTISPECIES: DUF5020 family protein [unclassified Moritella]EDM65572.1 hypothetical protein PE36_23802 [Moritella sp. PE36]MBL1417279.1 DUF5020 family protein [Moritella sp.]